MVRDVLLRSEVCYHPLESGTGALCFDDGRAMSVLCFAIFAYIIGRGAKR